MDSWTEHKSALLPMLIVGVVVGTGASEDSLWGVYGMGLAFCVWLAWTTARILGRAWVKTREARR